MGRAVRHHQAQAPDAGLEGERLAQTYEWNSGEAHMTLTDEQLAEILAGCEVVTPGPWIRSGVQYDLGSEKGLMAGPDGYLIFFSPIGRTAKTHSSAIRDLDHIARLDPQTVAALVTELQERRAGTDADPTERFIAEVRRELQRARTKFPGDRIMTIALAEEFGELAKAMLDEPQEAVWKEAVQTAVMAARVAIDGDSSVDQWRAAKELDNHRARPHPERTER